MYGSVELPCSNLSGKNSAGRIESKSLPIKKLPLEKFKSILTALHELFVGLTDPQDLWRFLQEHFQGQETFNQIELILLLVGCKLAEGKSISEYISRKTQLNRRLTESGITIPDMLFSAFLLCGLPKSLDICRRMLESRQHLDSSQIIRELHREEQRRKIELLTQDENEPESRKRKLDEAYISVHKEKVCKGHPDSCGKTNHNWEDCYFNPKSDSFNRKLFVQREVQRMDRDNNRNSQRKNSNPDAPAESSQKAEGKH
jgi:hypothetical protein